MAPPHTRAHEPDSDDEFGPDEANEAKEANEAVVVLLNSSLTFLVQNFSFSRESCVEQVGAEWSGVNERAIIHDKKTRLFTNKHICH